jgi:hypothetical protein
MHPAVLVISLAAVVILDCGRAAAPQKAGPARPLPPAATAGHQLATEIHRCLKTHYRLEGIESAEVHGLHAAVVLRISAEGEFVDARLKRPSGSDELDKAVLRSIEGCGRVSPPAELVREVVSTEGVEIVFAP